MGDSLSYSNTGISFAKQASKVIPMEIIHSEEGDSSSKADREDLRSDEEEEDLQRFEEIDTKQVTYDNTNRTSKSKKQKGNYQL